MLVAFKVCQNYERLAEAQAVNRHPVNTWILTVDYLTYKIYILVINMVLFENELLDYLAMTKTSW